MDEKQIISFEVAKLAKEKGFHGKSRFFYFSNSRMLDSFPKEEDVNALSDGYTCVYRHSLWNWLKSNKNIYIDVRISEKFNSMTYEYWFDILDLSALFLLYRSKKHYSTYEDALNDALKEGLNLIKMEETK